MKFKAVGVCKCGRLVVRNLPADYAICECGQEVNLRPASVIPRMNDDKELNYLRKIKNMSTCPSCGGILQPRNGWLECRNSTCNVIKGRLNQNGQLIDLKVAAITP